MSYNSPQDEGYSEDPLTLRGTSNYRGGSVLPQWMSSLTSLPAEERARVAMQIIQGLPTTMVEQIVQELRPRLCLDFIERLPTEVCLRILSFLDPVSLINMALSSREAKGLALDWKLWENLYYMEGWKTVPGEVQSFQQDLNSGVHTLSQEHKRPGVDEETLPSTKKRATPHLVSSSFGKTEDAEMSGVECVPAGSQSLFGGPIMTSPDGVNDTTQRPTNPSGRPPSGSNPQSSLRDMTNHSAINSFSTSSGDVDLPDIAALVTKDCRTGRQSLNWRHLYTQRRRLEANWDNGRYLNFQIPHPQHLYQAHSECIYTIQFQGRYLVSGSRDRSLRIWDMETRQLVLPPLIGHIGSVLCLQFDADPEEDIIVSGSSDATIILWRFSTGKAIQTIRNAHKESVLNVRFDHRILVTCSKDKFIKIFNRRPLRSGDEGYPMQQAVAPVPIVLNNYGFNPSPLADAPIIKPYTIIGTLEGHGAAVNAVQIWKNEIVSASGDRNVKVWDWPLQTCTRTLIGHSKGIACVQYDGRRIVSGSSDNEVKVFDKATGLEVASLRAHNQLVRTVQAGFGDLPFSTEEDQAVAKIVDHQYFEAVEQGNLPRSTYLNRGRPRNAGSTKPEHIMAYGAKLPPGGGGGHYKRIVSGSYDESVIIWRRDKEGAWKAMHTFRQEDAARAAAREDRPVRLPTSSKPNSGALLNGSLPPNDAFYNHFIDKAVRAGGTYVRQLVRAWPSLLTSERLRAGIVAETDPAIRIELQRSYNAELTVAVNAGHISPSDAGILPIQHSSIGSPTAGLAALSLPQPLHVAGAAFQPLNSAPVAASHPGMPFPVAPQVPGHQTLPPVNLGPPHVMAQAAAAQAAQNHLGAGMGQAHQRERLAHDGSGAARVFKLQYDARRIVACSQTAIIVGWDFANGDERLVDASRFFGAID